MARRSAQPEARGAQGTWRTVRLGQRVSFRLDRRALPVLLVLLFLLLAVVISSVSYGEYRIAPLDVVRATLGLETGNDDYRLVVRLFRLPRIVLAALVGAALAVSGTILQGVTRNPLADPGILGISSGAALAAVSLLVYFTAAPALLLPWAAFGGALLSAALIYLLAWRGGSSPLRLILIGIGFAAAAQALTTLLVVFGDINDVQRALVWLSGSVYGRGWAEVRVLALSLAALLPLTFLSARQLNTLSLGDESATGLGLGLERTRAFPHPPERRARSGRSRGGRHRRVCRTRRPAHHAAVGRPRTRGAAPRQRLDRRATGRDRRPRRTQRDRTEPAARRTRHRHDRCTLLDVPALALP